MSTNRNAEIIAAVSAGMKYDSVALEFGVSRSTVAGIVWRYKNPGAQAAYLRKVRKLGDRSAASAARDAAKAAGLSPRRAARAYDAAMLSTGARRLAGSAQP